MKLGLLVLLFAFQSFAATTLQPTCHQGQQIHHTYYSLCFDPDHKQSKWAFHKLTKEQIQGQQSRTNNFRVDPKVLENSPELKDYARSGYDRGHLVPAADMKLNRTSMSESFYLSNMSPQTPSFNRGVWKRIENLTRKWGEKYAEVFVATGPVLEAALDTIGSGVSIPRFFYKIIFRNTPNNKSMIAFLIENKNSKLDLKTFLTTVDDIEIKTGIDFFKDLDYNTQNELESKIDLNSWPYL